MGLPAARVAGAILFGAFGFVVAAAAMRPSLRRRFTRRGGIVSSWPIFAVCFCALRVVSLTRHSSPSASGRGDEMTRTEFVFDAMALPVYGMALLLFTGRCSKDLENSVGWLLDARKDRDAGRPLQLSCSQGAVFNTLRVLALAVATIHVGAILAIIFIISFMPKDQQKNGWDTTSEEEASQYYAGVLHVLTLLAAFAKLLAPFPVVYAAANTRESSRWLFVPLCLAATVAVPWSVALVTCRVVAPWLAVLVGNALCELVPLFCSFMWDLAWPYVPWIAPSWPIREAALAVALGLHPRLGKDSPLQLSTVFTVQQVFAVLSRDRFAEETATLFGDQDLFLDVDPLGPPPHPDDAVQVQVQ
eukprot:m51a1_g6688 hypothetical protein (360) ;mRNA; r:57131-58616